MSKFRTNQGTWITVAVFASVILTSTSLTAGAVHFAVIGDRTGGHVPGVHGEIVTEVERLRPDFVMTVGDMIEGYYDDSAHVVGEWHEYDSLIAPLTMPIHYTPGNHDIWSDLGERMFRRYAAEPYYSFDYEGLHFVILDVSRWESSAELPSEEIDWLANDLMTHQDASYTFLFQHKPFWYSTVAKGKADTLHSLLVKFGVDVVFTGHYHEFFSATYDGVHYVSVGSSGAETIVDPTGLEYHFMWVTVDPEGVHLATIAKGGVLPDDVVTATDKMAYDKVKHFGLQVADVIPVSDELTVNETRFMLTANNTISGQDVSDTLRWSTDAGWQVEPAVLPVALASGEEQTFEFTAKCDSNVFRLPVATLVFPFANGAVVDAQCAPQLARTALSHHVDTAPVIDGALSDGCWQDPVTSFVGYNGAPEVIDSTGFYFCYDDQNLYLAAYCHESQMDSLMANTTEHDGAIYGEDCVGYFIEASPYSDTAYQIYFNPKGVAFDQILTRDSEGWMGSDRRWDGVYDVMATQGDNFWSIEAKIPLDQFGVIAKQDQQWRVNFRRKQKHLNDAGDWQPIDSDPKTYGLLLFK